MIILAGSMVISLIALGNGNCMSKKNVVDEMQNHEERKDNNENE